MKTTNKQIEKMIEEQMMLDGCEREEAIERLAHFAGMMDAIKTKPAITCPFCNRTQGVCRCY